MKVEPYTVNVYRFFYSEYLITNTDLRDHLQEHVINHQLIEQMKTEKIIYQSNLYKFDNIFYNQNRLARPIPPHRRLVIFFRY